MCGVDLGLVAIVTIQCWIRMVPRAELPRLGLIVVGSLVPPVVNVALRSVVVARLVGPVIHIAIRPVVRYAMTIIASAVSGESLWSAGIVEAYRNNRVSLG